MVNKVYKDGSFSGNDVSSITNVILKLAQQFCHERAASNTVITDNSGGTANTSKTVSLVESDFENEANSGTSLAQTTDTRGSLTSLRNALATLYAVSNDVASDLGLTQVTYNGGGTNGSGTVAAIDTTITAAATGVQASEMNALKVSFNNAIYTLSSQVNELCRATGVEELNIEGLTFGTYSTTIPSIDPNATGTAASPGVSASSVQAAITQYNNDIATIIARINAVVTLSTPLVVGG